MNEWSFIGQDILLGIGKSDTINEFKQWCGLAVLEMTLLSNPLA